MKKPKRKFPTHIGLTFSRLIIVSLHNVKVTNGIVSDRYYLCKCSWQAMRRRCLNPQPQDAKIYGGIKIDSRWEKFESFLSDMGKAPTPAHSLDRLNVHKGYGPDNCRWATSLEQQTNKKNTLYVTVGAEKIPLRIACEHAGLGYQRMYYWVRRRGLSWASALERIKV